MASEYRIHRPYVLATLPRPLDHTDGRIVAREVYGEREGQKKRKRTEVAVGIDGETASIYDVPAARLITSYPIPPQESFTCAPYSTRIRRAGSSEVSRYTFIATRENAVQKITLFKDVVHADGKTISTTASQTLRTSAVRYITCSTGTSQFSAIGHVIVVCQNGEIICLAGETLAVQWTASSKSVVQDIAAAAIKDFEVEYVTSGSVGEFSEGIFKGRPETFSALPRALDANPAIIALVSKSSSNGQESHHLTIVAALPPASPTSTNLHTLTPLDVVPIPSTAGQSDKGSTYQVDVQSGLLMQLQQGALSVYELTGAIPKLKSTIQMDDAETFTRVSKPFVLSCSLNAIGLYNHQYRSIHASTPLDLSELPAESRDPRSCHLISYLRSQEVAVALVDNVLVAIQVEPPKSQGKRRKTGLLIDSIGRGAVVGLSTKKLKSEKASTEFSHQVPGTMTEAYLEKYSAETQAADELLGSDDLPKWESLLRKKFRMPCANKPVLPNGHGVNGTRAEDQAELPEWAWLADPSAYPVVDRRWVTYALSQVFSVEATGAEQQRTSLRLVLPDSNVTTYLVVAGHLTLSNLRSAFREDLAPEAAESKRLAGDLIQCLGDADPSMTLLLNYLQATKLGEVELLLAIRALMVSMHLIRGSDKLDPTRLLANEPQDEANGEYDMDLDDLERELAATEHYLGDDSSDRSRGLTLALAKLWRLPAVSTVKALRTTLQTEEMLSLVSLLRVELIRGAWTSLYIDPTSFDSEGNEPPPDGVIALIGDLLGRCLDAVGAGGWLFNDAVSWADKSEAGDFLTALKLEVTAALEGVEEAVYLNGIVGEAARFGIAAQRTAASRQSWSMDKPIAMPVEGRDGRLLPLGLKTKQLPTTDKVVSGGEVVHRSTRETGHLISQKVEAYSLEKLAV